MINTKNFREKLLKYGSCFFVFVLPLIYFSKILYPYTAPKTFFFYGLVEILLAFWIYTIIIDHTYRLTKKTLLYFIPVGAFVLWMTVAGLVGINPEFSFWSSIGRGTGLLTLYHCLALAIITTSLVKHYGNHYLNNLMFWFVNGSFILALSVWFGNQGFNLLHFIKDDAGGGLIGNSSITAPYLMFALAFGLFLLFSKGVSLGKKWWVGTIMGVIIFSPLFINLYGLFTGQGILGNARGAILGIVVAVYVSLMAYLFFSKKKVVKIIGIAGILIGLFIFAVGWVQLVSPNTKLHQKFDQVATGGSRFIFWDIAQKSMNQHPWFGYGPENYTFAFQRNFNPQMSLPQYGQEGWNDRAHNIYYDTGVSGGYPAIIFYGLFILSILYALYKLEKNGTLNRIQISVLGGFLLGYIFQNLFVFDSTYSLIALFIFIGAIFAFVDDKKIEDKVEVLHDNLADNVIKVLLLAFCVISLIFFVYRPFKKAVAFYTVFNVPVDIRPAHYSDLLRGSVIGDQWDTSGIAYMTYKSYIVDPASIKNDPKLLPYIEKDISAYIQYLEQVMKRNTTDSRLYVSAEYLYSALNYFSSQPFDKVLASHLFDIADRAHELSPTDPQVYWSVAQVYIWAGDYKNVERTYKNAIALDPSIPESHKLLIKFAAGTKNTQLYNEAMTEAVKDIPGFVLN